MLPISDEHGALLVPISPYSWAYYSSGSIDIGHAPILQSIPNQFRYKRRLAHVLFAKYKSTHVDHLKEGRDSQWTSRY